MPWVSIGREDWGTVLLDLVPGQGDIPFGSPEFDGRFRIKADDEAFARELIDPGMMQWLVAARNQYCYEVSGDVVLVYFDRLKPDMLPSLLDGLVEFVRRIPAGVLEAYQQR